MTHADQPEPRPVAGLLVVIAAIAATLGHQLPASSSSTPTAHRPSTSLATSAVERSARPAVPSPTARRSSTTGSRASPSSTPDLLAALRRAATDAAAGGVELLVDSGWRSPAYQQRLLDEAISKYGSEEAATRWVATPETSAHVKGDAVDIGPSGAAAWLSAHGAAYGLCQIYGNEPWHYELRAEAVDHGCPPVYADPTHDPRMQR